MRKLILKNRGQALVEFAVVIPVFLSLLLGMCQFGFIFHDYLVVNEVAREGARTAVVGDDNATVRDKVKTMSPSLKLVDSNIIIEPADKRVMGEQVTVTVRTPLNIFIPFVGSLFPANFTLPGSVSMRMETDFPKPK